MSVPPQRNPWRSRFRSLAFAVGVGTSFYLVTSYALDRMRETRLRLSKERNAKELLKRSFNLTLSNVSYTFYALLPTLAEQLSSRYNVEAVSADLQGLSASQSSVPSVTTTPAASLLLEHPADEARPGPSESWASEFHDKAESDQSEGTGTDIHLSVSELGTETDDQYTDSSISQSISLPPSSSSASPASASSAVLEPSLPVAPPRTKAELWNELKLKSLTRSITIIYLLPLLLLLTQSQLSLLSRIHYLRTVREALPVPPSPAKKTGWLDYLSLDGMGLTEFAESTGSYLPFGLGSVLPLGKSTSPVAAPADDAEPAIDPETERLFLCFSWWLLNEGWKGIADRVEAAVRDEFGSIPLKRELSVDEWKSKLESVRARVETDGELPGSAAYSFIPHVLPPSTVPEGSPLPPKPYPAPLAALHAETESHVASTDFNLVLSLGISKLSDKLTEDVYGSEGGTKRLVDCLPGVTRWGRSVWDAIPEVGLEELLAIPELEAFGALIFGDWAVDLDA